MTTIEIQKDRNSPEFQANTAYFQQQLEELRQRVEQVQQGGGPEAIAKHRKRNKLLPRERIQVLCDPDTPFLELSPLAAWDMYENDAPSAGIITGIGAVAGQECLIVANDATVKGGTYFPLPSKSTYAPRRSRPRTVCPASIWSTRAAPSCRCRRTSFPTATTSAEYSTIRRACQPRTSRRSRPSWEAARQAALTCPPCRIRRSSCGARAPSF